MIRAKVSGVFKSEHTLHQLHLRGSTPTRRQGHGGCWHDFRYWDEPPCPYVKPHLPGGRDTGVVGTTPGMGANPRVPTWICTYPRVGTRGWLARLQVWDEPPCPNADAQALHCVHRCNIQMDPGLPVYRAPGMLYTGNHSHVVNFYPK